MILRHVVDPILGVAHLILPTRLGFSWRRRDSRFLPRPHSSDPAAPDGIAASELASAGSAASAPLLLRRSTK